MMTMQGIVSHPKPVMAGLDPAIQTRRHTVLARMDWMAASRAAMTSGGILRSRLRVRVVEDME